MNRVIVFIENVHDLPMHPTLQDLHNQRVGVVSCVGVAIHLLFIVHMHCANVP